jgi:septum formation inhibitor-activating ATPase MinD
MAARLRKLHQDDVRSKIQTSQLINRLTDHAVSDKPLLDASQVRAIDILLKKVLPDLQSVEHSGDDENPVTHEIRRTVVRP